MYKEASWVLFDRYMEIRFCFVETERIGKLNKREVWVVRTVGVAVVAAA